MELFQIIWNAISLPKQFLLVRLQRNCNFTFTYYFIFVVTLRNRNTFQTHQLHKLKIVFVSSAVGFEYSAEIKQTVRLLVGRHGKGFC